MARFHSATDFTKGKGIQHDYDNPTASLNQLIAIIKEFLPYPIGDALWHRICFRSKGLK